MEHRKKISPQIPYGWEQDPEDKSYIQSVPEELENLHHILHLMKEREVSSHFGADWLYATTGRPISAGGLRKILKTYDTKE
jgi:hypothetical protein